MQLKYLILLAVSGSIVALDQLTKYIVLEKLYFGQSLSVIEGFFDLTHVRNPGAAFGLLARLDPMIRVPLFIAIPIVALVVIAVLFKKLENQAYLLALAFSLVIGGAIGNLIDRAVYGYVIDFLHFHWKNLAHFPAFNVADITICVGVGILILDILRKDQKNKSQKHAPSIV